MQYLRGVAVYAEICRESRGNYYCKVMSWRHNESITKLGPENGVVDVSKKRSNTVRTTISVPHDLKRRMDKVAEEVNWSALACQAFQDKLAGIAANKEKVMSQILSEEERKKVAERIRSSEAVEGRADYRAGHAYGVSWAKDHGEAEQFRRFESGRTGAVTALAEWRVESQKQVQHTATMDRVRPGSVVALLIDPYAVLYGTEDEENEAPCGKLQVFWFNLLSWRPETEDAYKGLAEIVVEDPDWMQGFMDGVLAVYNEVRHSA